MTRTDVKIVGILETQVKESKAESIKRKLGGKWSWVDNYDHSQKGHIWVGWRCDYLDFTVKHISAQVVAGITSTLDTVVSFVLVVVCGLHMIGDMRGLWQKLGVLASDSSLPWLAMGYFNSVFELEHRVSGVEVN